MSNREKLPLNTENLEAPCVALRHEIEDIIGYQLHTPRDFVSAAGKITAVTGHYISVSTMKRFWGYIKGYSGSPSVYTLNTLAMFLGYPNFTSYVELNKTHGASDEQAINLQKLNSDIVNIKIRLMEIEQHLGLNNKVGE